MGMDGVGTRCGGQQRVVPGTPQGKTPILVIPWKRKIGTSIEENFVPILTNRKQESVIRGIPHALHRPTVKRQHLHIVWKDVVLEEAGKAMQWSGFIYRGEELAGRDETWPLLHL